MRISKNIADHLIRGIIGFGSLALAIYFLPQLGVWSMGLFGVGVFALKGCPMCWLARLIQNLSEKRAEKICPDGKQCLNAE